MPYVPSCPCTASATHACQHIVPCTGLGTQPVLTCECERSASAVRVNASAVRVNASAVRVNASAVRVNASAVRVNASAVRVNASECECSASECELSALALVSVLMVETPLVGSESAQRTGADACALKAPC